MTNPLIKNSNGQVEWMQKPGDIYVATGVGVHGKRFKAIRSESWAHISMINLFRGNKWLERDGKRYLIQSVNN